MNNTSIATYTDELTERTYEAARCGTCVTISEYRDGMSVWAGNGTWDGENIQDCAAVLGGSQEAAERIYDGLSEALTDGD